MSSIEPDPSRLDPFAAAEANACEEPPPVCAMPEAEADATQEQAQAVSRIPTSDAWQARLEAVNRGEGEPTALERHVLFFDTNHDGMLSVKEVRRGLERIGMDSWVERVFASTVNNALLAPPTRDRLIAFDIDIANIEKARHPGSNTGIFDDRGHFVPAKFEEMWARFDADGDARLTAAEVQAMVDHNTQGMSPRSRGRFSAQAEFDLLMKLCAYEDPATKERYVTPERMLAFYDGTLFDRLAAEVAAEGRIVRQPAHDEALGPSGPLPGRARGTAGPAAGPAAGAAFGDRLLAEAEPSLDAAGAATLGGMLSVCPYVGAAQAGAGPAGASAAGASGGAGPR